MADTRDEAPKRTARAAPDDAAEAERRLARYAAYGIPAATVGTAIVVGFVMSLGPAILVLAAGTLLGVIALLWASLRTLSGEAPLPLELEAMAVRSRKVDDLGERKRRVLRALKDLELEHSVGKIDDKDYASLGDRFRGEAKDLMREMDGQIDPLRDEAERIAKKYLAKRGLGEGDAKAEPKRGSDSATAKKPADDDDDDDTFPIKPRYSEATRAGYARCRPCSATPMAAYVSMSKPKWLRLSWSGYSRTSFQAL